MGTKSWRFLLPGSGSHDLHAVDLGTPDLMVYIDQKPKKLAALTFTGPEGCMLELKKGQDRQWQLLVNGLRVEDYDPNKRRSGDETLRSVRSAPEGSYLICPDIPTDHLQLNVIRKFRFTLADVPYEVEIAHYNCIWQVVCNGSVVERKVHTMYCTSAEIRFDIPVGEQRVRVPAVASMVWQEQEQVWHYQLAVDSVDVPVYWCKKHGLVSETPVEPPAVEHEAAVAAIAASLAPVVEPAGADEGEGYDDSTDIEVLPQGVSYDRDIGVYQANIRARSGRFVFLGDFNTPQEAHAAYLDAVPVYNPGIVIAPDLPA